MCQIFVGHTFGGLATHEIEIPRNVTVYIVKHSRIQSTTLCLVKIFYIFPQSINVGLPDLTQCSIVDPMIQLPGKKKCVAAT